MKLGLAHSHASMQTQGIMLPPIGASANRCDKRRAARPKYLIGPRLRSGMVHGEPCFNCPARQCKGAATSTGGDTTGKEVSMIKTTLLSAAFVFGIATAASA